jgi:hypothetical protein
MATLWNRPQGLSCLGQFQRPQTSGQPLDDGEYFWTPTNASWLNLIEPWFLVLEKTALYNPDLQTTDAIAGNLKPGIDYLDNHPRLYRWTKTL